MQIHEFEAELVEVLADNTTLSLEFEGENLFHLLCLNVGKHYQITIEEITKLKKGEQKK